MAYFHARNNEVNEPTADEVYECFDYLQQAITCLADTNVEQRSISKSGREMFSSNGKHQCRDSAGVFAFAEEWRVWNGKTFQERENISEAENVPGRIINYD